MKSQNLQNIVFLSLLIIVNSTKYASYQEDKGEQQLDFNYYHTTHQIDNEVANLEANCNGMLTRKQILDNPNIEIVSIKGDEREDQQRKMNAFFLFGEHARELISPETGLNIAKALCGQAETTGNVEENLQNFDFHFVLNANPNSRQKVEQGEYCLRVNENGVDLNRNWGDHWEHNGVPYSETFSGWQPESEPEVIALKKEVDLLRPDVFLTVHSGTYGMYTPYAYSNEKVSLHEKQMLDVLDDIDQKYCNCPSGAAGKEVGYLCPGTCLDYAYDKVGSKYSYAFEIYRKDYGDGWSFMQTKQDQGVLDMRQNDFLPLQEQQQYSCFLQTSTSSGMTDMSPNQCLEFFNPITKREYNEVVNNWTDAILEMTTDIYNEENQNLQG